MAKIEMIVDERGHITRFHIAEHDAEEHEWPYAAMFDPRTQRGTACPKTFGLHSHRGRYNGKRVSSKRAGSGKRRHLGDHITDTGTSPEELANRFAALQR